MSNIEILITVVVYICGLLAGYCVRMGRDLRRQEEYLNGEQYQSLIVERKIAVLDAFTYLLRG